MSRSDPQSRPEDQVDRLEERSDALGEQIDGVQRDWEAKQHDPDVPGMAGDPDRASRRWSAPRGQPSERRSPLSTARAAANRAIGTRKGEQDT